MSTFSLSFRKDAVSGSTALSTNITNNTILSSVFGDSSQASTVKEFPFDRNISRNVTNRVLSARFGDGYEQRVKNGINPKQEEISIAFANRSAAEITVISAYIDNKAGANFDIVINGETIKVAAEEYSINYSQTEFHTLNTVLRRVYEP